MFGLRALLKRTFGTVRGNPVRRFDAAAGGRRWSSNPIFGPINAEMSAGAVAIRLRSAYFSRNNAWLANGVEALVSNLVGTGIRPASAHPDPAIRKNLQNRFNSWASQADADGVTDFYGLQAMAVRQAIEAGECFMHLGSEGPGSVQLQLRLIPADLVDHSHTVDLGAAGQIVGGIEFDGQGRRVAYHIMQRGSDLFATTSPATRVPAADMIHLFQPLAPGQVRGIAWTATVLTRLHELDELEDAMLVRQKVAAMFAGFVTDPNSDPAVSPFGGDQDEAMPTLEPGTMQRLAPGQGVEFAQPSDASDGVAFIKMQLGAVAAGLGLPSYMLTGDLSEANYSSLRAGLVQFRRRIEALQYSIIIHQFCRPVWERFVTMAVLSGQLEASDFEANRADYLACEWYPPAQAWVDPLKDQQAEALAVASGFRSRRQVVAAQGYDIETLDAELAADKAREAALGLAFPAPIPDAKAQSDAA